MSSGKEKNNYSMCEKSMKMVVNMIKLSSFSIAKMSLGVRTESSLVKKNLAPVTASVTVTGQPVKSSQQFRSRSKPYSSSSSSSFVMQKAEDGGEGLTSTYMVREGNNSLIDGMASDYIRKFHEKNSREHVKSKLYRPYFPSPTVK